MAPIFTMTLKWLSMAAVLLVLSVYAAALPTEDVALAPDDNLRSRRDIAHHDFATYLTKSRNRRSLNPVLLNIPGVQEALALPESEIIKILKKEENDNEALKDVWNRAEAWYDPNADYGILNPLSRNTKIALRAITYDTRVHGELSCSTRYLIEHHQDWEAFHYKGLFVLLYKAVSSDVGRINPTTLYRGVHFKFQGEVGQMMNFNQIAHTSIDIDEAKSFARGGTLFVLTNVRQALPLSTVSYYPQEQESLILPNQNFRISEKEEIADNILQINLEFIN